ncbi:transmembrane and coiled-coil domain protein 3-like isoform X1 [Polyodon spathula]|uniref:transmembrane and coiled-coil domain protein 3-like isoform X1 n=1 Tax=Polyodon spathula TaxID=7913 RepID=UPI001B7E9F99|nr:transmembrane and coiled-coil domain protein 3-like isoform X1 [Polyodon spathula]
MLGTETTTAAVDRSLPEPEKHSQSRSIMADRNDVTTLTVPATIQRGGSDSNLNVDVTDGILDFHKSRITNDNLQQKILKITESMKIEQSVRDENVVEYLKLVNCADKQQVARIKQVFEKKNQKSAHTISQLQKKLEQYHKKLKEIEQNVPSKNSKDASKDNLKDIQQTPKDAGSTQRTGNSGQASTEKSKTVGPGVSLTPPFFFNKPREFANLIRNRFGSADNIAQLKNSLDTFHPEGGNRALSGSATIVAKPKYPSDDESSSGTSASADSNGNHSFGPGGSNTLESQTKFTKVFEDLQEMQEMQTHLAEDIENLKIQFKREYGFITQTLQEERYRYERLEDQFNDLTELHQHETTNLKQELSSIEEKVAYQAYERSRDIEEVLESCQTKISKLELQQQQQQVVQFENTNAKVLLGKSINIMLAIVTVILVCVSTIAKFTAPLMKSRLHVISTFFAVALLAVFWKNWEHFQIAIERLLLPN